MRFTLSLLRSPGAKLFWQECRCSAGGRAWNPTFRRYVSSTEVESYSSDTETEAERGNVGDGVINKKRVKVEVPCPDNSKLMKISIIGLPNAGKITIINALTKYDVCPVSKRPHTTRNNQQAVFLDDETQLVFVDTPGLVNVKEIKKFGFTEEFFYGPERSIGTAHIVAVMHDVSNATTRDKLDFRIKGVLQKFPDKKAILILNKIDTVKKKDTLLETMKYLTGGFVGGQPLPMITFQQKKQQSHRRLNTEDILATAKQRYLEKLSSNGEEEDKRIQAVKKLFSEDEIRKGVHEEGWPHFSDVFMVSALENDGVELLRRYLTINAVPDRWLFDSETLTNVPPMKLTLKIVRAKLLDHLPQEIPFKVIPSIDFWDESESGGLCISIKIRCPKERYKWRIVGTGGTIISTITEDIQASLSSVLCQPVKLTLNPVVDELLAKKEKK